MKTITKRPEDNQATSRKIIKRPKDNQPSNYYVSPVRKRSTTPAIQDRLILHPVKNTKKTTKIMFWGHVISKSENQGRCVRKDKGHTICVVPPVRKDKWHIICLCSLFAKLNTTFYFSRPPVWRKGTRINSAYFWKGTLAFEDLYFDCYFVGFLKSLDQRGLRFLGFTLYL